MLRQLKHISPKTRILFFAFLLILLPSAILSFFGLQSVNQKIEHLRAHYRSTVGLVRDKMEREVLRVEEGVSTFILKSPPWRESTRDLQDWLGRLQSTNAFLTQPFLLHANGGVLSTKLSKRWTGARPVASLRSSVAATYFHSAEAAEFANHNILEARKLYQRALRSTSFDEDRAVILGRIGRCYFKAGRYHEGIEEYRNILALKGSLPDMGFLPPAALLQHGESQVPFGIPKVAILRTLLNRTAVREFVIFGWWTLRRALSADMCCLTSHEWAGLS